MFPLMSSVCYRRLCGSPIVCTRSSASSAAVVQRSCVASLGVGGMRKESGLALLLSSSNICGPPGAMLQVSAGLVIRAHSNDFVSKSKGKPTALT